MNVLAMFARHWTPGQAKTRLATRWGDDLGSRLHLIFLQAALRRFAMLGDERWLVFTPPEMRPEFESVADGSWQLREQACGDLGERMATLCASGLKDAANRLVLIGADSPTLPSVHIELAFELLLRVPVVLAQAHDGGYCLLGVSRHAPPIFHGVDWGNDRVWRQTIERLQSHRCPYACLPAWHDIDTPEDLERLRRELASACDPDLMILRGEIESLLHR